MSNRRVRYATVSMGLRWKTVKGRAHPLTRLSLGTLAPSCWTKLLERTEGKRRERVRENKWVTRGACSGKRKTEAAWRMGNEGRNQGRELRIGGKRRAELSAESPGRKTRHHRKIALSRTHLFSIPSSPSSWPFHPRVAATLERLFTPEPADSSVRQRIYKSVLSVFFVTLGVTGSNSLSARVRMLA